jgi:hypothetical protein
MGKDTYDFDLVYTADDGTKILLQNQPKREKEKEAAKLKAYAEAIADATGNKK